MKRLALILFLAACGTETPSIDPPEVRSDLARDTTPDVSDAQVASAVEGNTAFAAALYRQVHTEPGNLFMSPHSISTALAMTYAGAAGNTASQMAETLQFTLPATETHAAFNRIDAELASRAADASGDSIPFKLTTANGIFGQDGKEWLPSFLDTLALNYGAGLYVLDFVGAAEAARETINAWVEARTNDRIEDLLPEGSIDPSTRLVLTNAIYFSAAWDDPFDAADTADRDFLVGGAPVKVPTLYQKSVNLSYGEGTGFRAAELPYDGDKLSMTVVVPDDMAAFEATLSADKLAEVTASLGSAELELTLPKFEFDAPLGLKKHLQAMGMVDAFSDEADFSAMDGTRSLAIVDVLHEGFVAIDEKGTEAAAATAVIVGETSAPLPATLHVDRPFVFFIKDRPTGAILFIGRVVDPR